MMIGLQRAERADFEIMRARTLAKQRGATPLEVQRNVEKYETDVFNYGPAKIGGIRGPEGFRNLYIKDGSGYKHYLTSEQAITLGYGIADNFKQLEDQNNG